MNTVEMLLYNNTKSRNNLKKSSMQKVALTLWEPYVSL